MDRQTSRGIQVGLDNNNARLDDGRTQVTTHLYRRPAVPALAKQNLETA